jgi:hypothetical protein
MELTRPMTDLFEILSTNFSGFCNLAEHLAVDEVIVKFKGRVVFRVHPEKMQMFLYQNV